MWWQLINPSLTSACVWCLTSNPKSMLRVLDMQRERFRSPITLRGKSLLYETGNIQIKKPAISTLDSYISHSSFHSLIINLLHYSTKVYLCFPWVFNLCQQWLCSNINETCPSTKISTVAVQICTAPKQAEWATTHLYTCNQTHTQICTHIDRHISLFYSICWLNCSFASFLCLSVCL